MVKLIVIARCISEDVYLAHADHALPAVAGKKFSVVVREPDSWYIGRLAIEIQNRYEALYKRPLGQIKYLKDAEDDCDLDLELTVADLLVDEGKALQDSSDQKRIVLVVVDQGRAVRQGSVVPDLTPLHYQPTIKPPVPRFPAIEKRIPEELEPNDRPPKRRRLDQIENDEGEEIFHSIEGLNGLNNRGRRSPSHFEVPGAHFLSALNTGNIDPAAVEIKREWSGPQFWPNTTPATPDELQLLPQQPENWQSQQRRTGLPPSRLRNGASDHENIRQSATTPITPGANDQVRQSPSANAINMLNGMKSISPALRQPTSSSASRFRGPRKNVYDIPESDVEDSQMSPESKAGRKPITPRLVPTPRSVDTTAAKRNFRSALLKKPVTENETVNLQNNNDESTLLPDGTEAADREPQDQKDLQQDAQMDNDMSWERDRLSKLAEAVPNQAEISEVDQQNQVRSRSKTSTSGEGGTGASIRSSKRNASSRVGRPSSGATSTSRSSSVASSASGTGQSTSSRSTGKKLSYTRDRETLTENEEDDTLDSPGFQLEETLRQSSPVPRKSTESRSRASANKTKVREDTGAEAMEDDGDDEAEGDVTRPPESVSDSEEAVQPAKPKPSKKRSARTAPVRSRATVSGDDGLRCYTCWAKRAICDNAKPKCSYCSKWKKNCQIYGMTQEDADEEKENRKSRKVAKSTAAQPVSRGPSKSIRKAVEPELSDEVVSASDREDESEPEENTEDDDRSTKKQIKASRTEVPKPKAEPSRQKKKVDKKKASNAHTEQLPKEIAMIGQTIENQADADVSEEEPQTQQAPEKPNSKQQDQGTDNDQDEVAATKLTIDNTMTDSAPTTASSTNLDTQCSVVSATGLMCPRNLGCRLHAMAKKRAVQGRSQPFGILLKRQQEQGKASTKLAAEHTETEKSAAADDAHQSEVPMESMRPTNVHEQSVDSASTHTNSAKAPSIASRATPSVPVLPPGMTQEEYSRLVSDRSTLTEQEWSDMKKKLALKRSTGSQKQKSPLVVRSQHSQSSSQKPRIPTPSVKSDDKVTSSSQASKRKQVPASTQPEPNSHTFAIATTPGPVNTLLPKSVPSKSDPARQLAADARINGRLKMHPVLANTAATLNSDKHANPPYRQPLRKPPPSIAIPRPPQDLGGHRTVKELKAHLKSGGSGASTPQPQFDRDKLSAFASSVPSKQRLQLEDEDEDEDATASEEDESPVREETKPKTPRFTAVNEIGLGNLHNGSRRAAPTQEESSESSDDEWSK